MPLHYIQGDHSQDTSDISLSVTMLLCMLNVAKLYDDTIRALNSRDVPDFSFPNPAGAGARAGFQNLVQRKTTPELQ